MSVGYVYVLKSLQAPIYKIGKAAEHRIDQRLKELGVGVKNELIGYYRLADYSLEEREIHRTYAKFRIPQSEYFALPDEDLAWIISCLERSKLNGYVVEMDEPKGGYHKLTVDYSTSDLVTIEDNDCEYIAFHPTLIPPLIEKLRLIYNDLIPVDASN